MSVLVVRKFPAEPWAALAARRIVEMTTADMPHDTAHAACVIATELVTNSVRHGAGPVELRLRFRTGQPLRIEVLDQGGGFEPELPITPPPADETAGRGLYVVDQVANRWGMDRGSGATWAEIDPPQPRKLARLALRE